MTDLYYGVGLNHLGVAHDGIDYSAVHRPDFFDWELSPCGVAVDFDLVDVVASFYFLDLCWNRIDLSLYRVFGLVLE